MHIGERQLALGLSSPATTCDAARAPFRASDRAVQAVVIVILDEGGDHAACRPK